jgi:hypothetical protein
MYDMATAIAGQCDYDIMLMCELTTPCTNPPALQYVYRKKNAHQLCYGIESGPLQINTQTYTPHSTPCYTQAKFKGGNDFTKLAQRAPGWFTFENITIYFFHAPANHKAVKTIAYLACDLNHRHGADPWILVGDFNVEPDVLGKSNTGIVLGDLIRDPDRATHNSDKKLDYALSNIRDLKVTTLDGNGFSDHHPILIET